MKVEDLRIGNYVKYTNKVFMIEYLQKTGIVGIVNPLTRTEVVVDMLRPILVDDDFLNKNLGDFGTWNDFYEGKIYYWMDKHISRSEKSEDYYFGVPCGNSYDEEEPYQEYEIHGVHDIQNIYKVLYGEELTLDLFK